MIMLGSGSEKIRQELDTVLTRTVTSNVQVLHTDHGTPCIRMTR